MQINQIPFWIEPESFLKSHWQKKHLLLRQAFSQTTTLINGDDLAALASKSNVESRIITGENTSQNWRCEYGPFDNFDYAALGTDDWTLLVQSVDHFIPAVRDQLDNFSFIPQWRLDDVMVSYATKGGGVGPHFDYYDVFLIQISGSREWKIGQQCDASSLLRDHADLKLLQDFHEADCYELHEGDMIYVPAGLAHWGTATSHDCITASIGFRAPSYQDLVYSAAFDISAQFEPHLRYRDRLGDSKLNSYDLGKVANKQFEDLYTSLDKENFIKALRTAFAKEVTYPRHEELFETNNYSEQTVTAALGSNQQVLLHHPNTRLAYIEHDDKTSLFVNGEEHITDSATALAICHSDYKNPNGLDWSLITELLNAGHLIVV